MTTEGFPGAPGHTFRIRRAAGGARNVRAPRPPPRPYIGPCPSRDGQGREPMPTEPTAKAAEGSDNQPESTLALSSNCPTK